ncbi:MAG: type III-A CRISPR-associated protein Csm2 [Chitinophagales bacterium]|nr:type III-A CRISPR-associated protein Csm2 [Chitinophagales bacterium]
MTFDKTKFKKEWIQTGLDESTIEFADNFGKHLCDLQQDRPGREAMTTSQIRNYFGEVRRIQAKGYENDRPSFLLLRPKLAYAQARVVSKMGKSRISDFKEVMDTAHKAVSSKEQFQHFVDFLEATLAYHKFYGGRD